MCGCDRPSTDELDAMRVRAVMCFTCRSAVRVDRMWFARWLWPAYGDQSKARDVRACAVSKRPVRLHIGGRPCPRGRFAASRRWMGLAYPRRLLAWAMGMNGNKLASLPGCGCFRPAKDAWEGFWAWALKLPRLDRRTA